MSAPAFQTEWVDVMEQTRALLHHDCSAPARTITARVSRELGNSIERRKPANSSLGRFLQDLEASQSAAASRDACSTQDAHIRAYAHAFAEATRLGVGAGHAAASPSAASVPSPHRQGQALTPDSMAALLVSAGADAQLVRVWLMQRAEALAARCARETEKRQRQLPSVQEAAGVKLADSEQGARSPDGSSRSISLYEFVDCCRVCGVQPAALLGRHGNGGAWARLRARHADAAAFDPDASSNAARSAAAPNANDYATPIAANARVVNDDDLPTLIRIQQRHAAMESGHRGSVAAAAAAKRARRAKTEDSRSEDCAEPGVDAQRGTESETGSSVGVKDGEAGRTRVAQGARLYATPLEKHIVAARVQRAPSGQGAAQPSPQHSVSTRDVVAGGLDGRARRAKRRSERARRRTGSALQVATNLAGSVGMISRHLANEHLKARRQDEEAAAKFVVDRRKHTDRVVRTRYAVHRDRTLARRDRELLRSRLERNAMIEQAQLERQLEEDLIRQFKKKQELSESTCIIDEHLQPEQLAELRGHERHAALQDRAKGNLRQRDAKIAAYTAERRAASRARVHPTVSHSFDGSELEDDELQQGYRTLLSGQQRHALNMQVHADSPFGVDFAVSHPRPLSLSHAPGQGIVPPPPASVAAHRIYATAGSTLPVPSPVFNTHGPRQFAARCDDDNNAFHVLEQKVVNKRYLET